MATLAGFDAGVPMPHSSCMSYVNLITIDPARRSGKPCARDTRITVYDVLDYLASGMTAGEIVEAFPELGITVTPHLILNRKTRFAPG